MPLILSITFLPFLYLYSLFVKYEELWMRLNFGIKNEQDRKRVKQQIFRVANFNINKLINISKNIAEPIYVYNDFSNNMIKAVSKGKYTDFFNK